VNQAELRQLRRNGSMRAQRALRSLDLDVEHPVDVFGAIEGEHVWLMFQPLDRLYGAYERRVEAAGIVVHALHPVRAQRFTAAHELGHHMLGHEVSIDPRDFVESTDAELPAQEVEAQAFAATFLMPVQLVNRALSRVGLQRSPNTIDPEQAYRLSLELGSSYTATVTQLRALDRITYANARELLRAHPIDIKTTLARGERPLNARADVWPLTLADSGRELWIGTGDEVHAVLPESPTTGFRWQAEDGGGVELAGNRALRVETDGRRYGGTRERHVWWRAQEAADVAVGCELRRSFEGPAAEPAGRFEVALHVLPAPTGAANHGLIERQRQLL
jgi:Zn-dependent peptidase ImmA (M78 family)/predicted secreted protein